MAERGNRKRARESAAAPARGKENFSAESVDATTYGVLLTPPTLCVVPSAGFVTIRSSTRASLEIVPVFAAAACVSSALIVSLLMSKSNVPICA